MYWVIELIWNEFWLSTVVIRKSRPKLEPKDHKMKFDQLNFANKEHILLGLLIPKLSEDMIDL